MSNQKKSNSKNRQRIQTVEAGTAAKIVKENTRHTNPDIFTWFLVIVIFALGLLVWKGIVDSPPKATEYRSTNSIPLLQPITNNSDLAKALDSVLNSISPTSPLGSEQWLATEISFVRSKPNAYIIYTDTHITLRILLEYEYNSTSLATKVLATFIPDETGRWQLHYGKDLSGPIATEDYAYDPAIEEWLEK